MKISPEILNELKAVSPLLAELERVNVFQVPEGYFNELGQRIADYAILNNGSAVENITRRNLQQVPEDYFDNLSNLIMAKVKAIYNETTEEELKRLSPILFSLRSENVFSVPSNYFDSLADSIFTLVNANNGESAEEELRDLSLMLVSLKNKNVFTVPANYFEALSSSVLDTVKSINKENAEEEIQNLSPMLFSLKEENVFSVPSNYFDSFAGNVYRKILPKPAKVITMNSKKSWWKYAAAAVVTGAIAFGSLQIFDKPFVKDLATASLSEDVKASFQYKNENDLNAGIAKLSDDDIIKYLEKNGNVMDNELLTNNTDVSEMPSQTEYLTDENTLNNYLDKIDAETNNKSNP